MKLLFKALTKFIMGLLLVGVLVFLPAGSFGYLNGWLFCILLFVPMLILGTVLFVKNPSLLEKRLESKEKASTQKGVVAISGLLFLASFVVAGLDYRFGWSKVPFWLVVLSSAVLLVSYGLYAEVMRENAYLSRVVKVEEGQKVVDTGLYGIVRHPMYSATLGLFLSIPLVLGSFWAFGCMLPYLAVIAVRILDEEKLLGAELEGYSDYTKRVKYRLIPFIW